MSNPADIALAVNCMGYGYQLSAAINGKDIGMKGGQSEGSIFFGPDHPMRKEAAPEIIAKHFILTPGENTFHLEYKKVGEPTDKLTLEITKGEETEPFIKLETVDASGVFDKTFSL